MKSKVNNLKYQNLISKNIKHFRILRGYSQQELEHLSKIADNYITNLECNKKDIKISTLIKICDVLDIELTEVFQDRKNFITKKRVDSK